MNLFLLQSIQVLFFRMSWSSVAGSCCCSCRLFRLLVLLYGLRRALRSRNLRRFFCRLFHYCFLLRFGSGFFRFWLLHSNRLHGNRFSLHFFDRSFFGLRFFNRYGFSGDNLLNFFGCLLHCFHDLRSNFPRSLFGNHGLLGHRFRHRFFGFLRRLFSFRLLRCDRVRGCNLFFHFFSRGLFDLRFLGRYGLLGSGLFLQFFDCRLFGLRLLLHSNRLLGNNLFLHFFDSSFFSLRFFGCRGFLGDSLFLHFFSRGLFSLRFLGRRGFLGNRLFLHFFSRGLFSLRLLGRYGLLGNSLFLHFFNYRLFSLRFFGCYWFFGNNFLNLFDRLRHSFHNLSGNFLCCLFSDCGLYCHRFRYRFFGLLRRLFSFRFFRYYRFLGRRGLLGNSLFLHFFSRGLFSLRLLGRYGFLGRRRFLNSRFFNCRLFCRLRIASRNGDKRVLRY